MAVAEPPAGEDRIARIEGMLEGYLGEHTKLHEETRDLISRVEQRSYDLGERMTTEQRTLSDSLTRLEAGIRAWRGVFFAVVAVASVLIGAFGAPLLTGLLSR